jgi:hypothetical protein
MSNVKGMPQLKRRLHAIGETEGLLRLLQLETIAGAKARVPRKTGHLARSIVAGPVSDTQATVEARTPYAAAVEFGSRPHEIVPVHKRALAWPGTAAGRRLSGRARTRGGQRVGPTIFAKRVHHPGTKAKPFLIPAAKEALRKHGVGFVVDRWNDAA